MRPLDHVAEQLWAPVLARGDHRMVVDTSEDAEWRDVERYWLVPNAASARLLVPQGSPSMVSRVLTNYRHLRRHRKNVSRLALGALARVGAPVSRSSVALQVRRDVPQASPPVTPLALLSQAVGRPLVASTGVRTSDNRKTTLHLVDIDGRPVGYAKLGWNPTTDALVATEGRALRRVGARPGLTRAPGLVAELDYHGHPVVVSEAMPTDVRGGPNGAADPTAQEMFWLTPVERYAVPAATGQFRASLARLQATSDDPVAAAVSRSGLRLAERLRAATDELPVTALWHGDMAPWNRARERSGQLWVWDWETAENDAVAGLDAINWVYSTHRLQDRSVDEIRLGRCVEDAAPYLRALGLARRDWPTVAAVYALCLLARATELAAASGSWDAALLSPAKLQALVDEALSLVDAAQTRAGG